MPSSTLPPIRKFEGAKLGLVAGRFVPLHSFTTTENVSRNHWNTDTVEVELTASRDPKIPGTMNIGRVFIFFRDYTLIFEDCFVRDVRRGPNGPYEVSLIAKVMRAEPR